MRRIESLKRLPRVTPQPRHLIRDKIEAVPKSSPSANAATAVRAERTKTVAAPLTAGADTTRLPRLAGMGARGLLCLLFLLAPLKLSTFWPADYDYSQQAVFVSVTAIGCLLMAVSTPRRLGRSHDIVPLLLTGFLAWCCISLFTGVYLHDALLELSRIGSCLVWFAMLRAFLLRPGDEAIDWKFCLALLGCMVLGSVFEALPVIANFRATHDPRQFGTFYNPNLLANFCAMALPLSLAWCLVVATGRGIAGSAMSGARRSGMVVGVAGSAIIGLGLLVTSSKGGLIAACAGILILAAALLHARGTQILAFLRKNPLIVAIALAVLLVGGGAVMQKTVLPRLHNLSGSDDNSTKFRYYTWLGTLHMAKARPLLGWGSGSYPSAYGQFAQAGYTRSAHELWLQIAAENGFPALALLLAAMVVAVGRGWRALRGPAWPLAAGGLGALAAFAVHGLMDSGWSVTSIVLLWCLAMACLDAAGRSADPSQAPTEIAPARGGALNYAWLVAAVVVGLGSSLNQHAVGAEDLRTQSRDATRNGNLESAQSAVAIDPLSGRMWLNLAQAQQMSGTDPRQYYLKAIAVQPTRASYRWMLATWYAAHGDQTNAAKQFDVAVNLEPNETNTRLMRAQWELARHDPRGWDDLKYIDALQDAPTGKYPPVREIVNLDFARADNLLAGHARELGDKAAALRYVTRGLAVVTDAQAHEDERKQLQEAAAGGGDFESNSDLPTLERDLNELKDQLQ